MVEQAVVNWDLVTPIQGSDPDREARLLRQDPPVTGPTPLLRQALVTDVDVFNGRCTVRIGGDDVDIPNVKHMSNYRPKVDDNAWILVNGQDMLVLDRTSNLGPSVISDAKKSTKVEVVTTTEVNWLHAEPLLSGVSVSPSGRLLVCASALCQINAVAEAAYMSVQVSHELIGNLGYFIPPDETSSLICYTGVSGSSIAASKVILYTGLIAGPYTIQSYYKCKLGTGGATFAYRHLWALPL